MSAVALGIIVPKAIVWDRAFSYNPYMFTTFLFQALLQRARYVGLAALFVVVPIAARASIITEQIDFTVNGLDGEATFTVDTTPSGPVPLHFGYRRCVRGSRRWPVVVEFTIQ